MIWSSLFLNEPFQQLSVCGKFKGDKNESSEVSLWVVVEAPQGVSGE